MNSVLQVLFAMPEFQELYYGNASAFIQGAPADPTDSFVAQMCVRLHHGAAAVLRSR